MSTPITDEQLDEIRARVKIVEYNGGEYRYDDGPPRLIVSLAYPVVEGKIIDSTKPAEDMRVLLAEVDRLRARVSEENCGYTVEKGMIVQGGPGSSAFEVSGMALALCGYTKKLGRNRLVNPEYFSNEEDLRWLSIEAPLGDDDEFLPFVIWFSGSGWPIKVVREDPPEGGVLLPPDDPDSDKDEHGMFEWNLMRLALQARFGGKKR